MRGRVLNEPNLEFAHAARHVDPRSGVAAFGPLDLGEAGRPETIRIGLVGPPDHGSELRSWLTRCREPIPGKPPKRLAQARLFPGFPGFEGESGYQATLVLDDRCHRQVSVDLSAQRGGSRLSSAVQDAVDSYMEEIRWLVKNTAVDVILCIRPELLEDDDNGSHESREERRRKPDFHDQLKMAALSTGVPLQVIRPGTWQSRTRPPQGVKRRRVQDEATRAWNLHTALYYKAGGRPWRLKRTFSDTASCYLGISFYRPAIGDSLNSSLAHLFNERGEGVVVHGGPAAVTKSDPRPFLTEAHVVELVHRTLDAFRDEHGHAPARLVVHKTSAFRDEELAGFRSAAEDARMAAVDLLWLPDDLPRLFRLGELPPQRGTFLRLGADRLMLYTRGTVPFYGTYPGLTVPVPLALRVAQSSIGPDEIAEETLALTKLNWNQSQLDNRLPITLHASAKVRAILAHGEPDDQEPRPYSHFM